MTRAEELAAALTPCEHRADVPCAGCEMARRRALIARDFDDRFRVRHTQYGSILEDIYR